MTEQFIGRSQADARTSRTMRLRRFVPGVETLLHYDREWLSADVIAGVSVAAVAVPIAIAYSQLAGVPPAHGLYASVLPLLAYAAFGSSRQLIMAPDAATCAIVAATVLPLAGADLQRYVSLTAALAIAAGIVCIAAGLARLGFLTNFLARPILTGYLNGIAVMKNRYDIDSNLGPSHTSTSQEPRFSRRSSRTSAARGWRSRWQK